jgi:hypothetical protein
MSVDLFDDPGYHTYIVRIAVSGDDRMHKKLTITIDGPVYDGLHSVIGARRISRFIEDLVRPYVVLPNLDAAYQQMAADAEREAEALEWAEATVGDVGNAARRCVVGELRTLRGGRDEEAATGGDHQQ